MKPLPVLTLALILGLIGLGPVQGADRTASVTKLGLYPDDQPGQVGMDAFVWPEQKELSAVVSLELAGFDGEQKVEVFLVVFDENEKVVSKFKGKHNLPAGNHDIVFPAILSTEGLFGSASFTAKVEVTLTGAVTAYASTDFTISGPDPPNVEIWDMQMLNSEGTPNDTWFEPGEEFGVEATFEVGNNPTDIEPMVMVYAVVEEDSNLVDPEYEYQPYLLQWDMRRLGFRDGMFHLQARGRLPEHFYYNYDSRHPFRVWVIVDFGHEARTKDYARGEIIDNNPGDHRASEEVEPRLIEIERSIYWDLERDRKSAPERDRFND